MLSCCTSISHEARLLRDCYPPSKQLVPPPLRPGTNANPTSSSSTAVSVSTHVNLDDSYKPLGQELSRLTYHASNKPGTLNALGRELEDKVVKEVGRARGGNGKSRIYILISLQILRSLLLECKRDIPLFSRSTLRIIELSIGLALGGGQGAGGVDLEMAVRVGACFTAFATYGTAQSLGADDMLAKTYVTTLRQFASISTRSNENLSSVGINNSSEKATPRAPDTETRNRTRLIGLAALSAAANSDLLFAGSSDFGQQARVIVPALLENLELVDVRTLEEESAKVKLDADPSPYFSEFAPTARPAMATRRAPSLRNHVAGEKGPSTVDVVGGALQTLENLIGQCQANQLSGVMSITLAYMDDGPTRPAKAIDSIWTDSDRCCCLAEIVAAYSMLQYRFVIPTALVEELAQASQPVESSTKTLVLLAMLTRILSARELSLVGISTIDLLSSLCSLIVRRVKVSAQDPTLPALVQCIASLGRHTYYADQTNDYIEELVSRIGLIQSAGQSQTAGTMEDQKEKAVRAETVRILVACMTNIMLVKPITSSTAKKMENHPSTEDEDSVREEGGHGSQDATKGTLSRRNPISPTVWQETLPLLCDSSFAVRAEYARSLILYLKQECPTPTTVKGESANEAAQGSSITLNSDLARFLNALFATVYTLAVSPRLGFAGVAKAKGNPHALDQKPALLPQVGRAIPPAAPINSASGEQEIGDDLPSSLPSGPREAISKAPTMGRRSSKLVSLPFSRSEVGRTHSSASNGFTSVNALEPSAEDVAGSFDYLVIQEVLTLVFRKYRPLSILWGVPMLLALDRDIVNMALPGDTSANSLTQRACQEVVLASWKAIAPTGSDELARLRGSVEKAQNALPPPSIICRGPVTGAKSGLFVPDKPIWFTAPTMATFSDSAAQVSPSVAIFALSTSAEMEAGLGLATEDIVARLSVDWTVEWALRNSVEDFGFGHATPSRHVSYNHAAEDLMRNSNPSLSSFVQSGSAGGRGVDLADLREALAASRSNSFTGLASLAGSAISIRSGSGVANGLGNGHGNGLPRKKLKPEEAREILKDIFKKKRSGQKQTATDVGT